MNEGPQRSGCAWIVIIALGVALGNLLYRVLNEPIIPVDWLHE